MHFLENDLKTPEEHALFVSEALGTGLPFLSVDTYMSEETGELVSCNFYLYLHY